MGVFKRGGVWWMRFAYQDRQVRKSTETTNRKLAGRIYDKILGEIAEGKWFERMPGEEKTFREMMERYMAEHSIPNKASTVRDQTSLNRLLPFFGDYAITQIAPRLINEYKSLRRSDGIATSSINRELALMKHAFTLAIREWGWVDDNPVKRIAMEKEPPPRDRWLTYEEEEQLLLAAPNWLGPMIVFAVETGCRKGEMFSLGWNAVDLFGKVITIDGTKTGEKRSIPLTGRAVEILNARRKQRAGVRSVIRSLKGNLVFNYPEGQKVDSYKMDWAFKKALEETGVEGFRWHDLRHTFASRLAQAGVETYTIQRLMGHRSFTTTQRYAHHYVESLRRGIGFLEVSRAERVKQLAQF